MATPARLLRGRLIIVSRNPPRAKKKMMVRHRRPRSWGCWRDTAAGRTIDPGPDSASSYRWCCPWGRWWAAPTWPPSTPTSLTRCDVRREPSFHHHLPLLFFLYCFSPSDYLYPHTRFFSNTNHWHCGDIFFLSGFFGEKKNQFIFYKLNSSIERTPPPPPPPELKQVLVTDWHTQHL